MSNNLDKIFKFNKSNIDLAGKVCAKAYSEDPLFCWFFPEISKRRKYLSLLFNITFRYIQKYGEVYAPSSNIEGIAAWLPYDKSFIPLTQLIRFGFLFLIFKAGLKKCQKDECL